MGNPVCWFEIYVQDLARARRFYEAVFQVELQPLGPPELEMLAWPGDMSGYGSPGALVHMKEVPSGCGGTLVYFSCRDCAVEASRAVEAGGSLRRAKMSIGEYGFIALVTDTEGNLVGLHSLA